MTDAVSSNSEQSNTKAKIGHTVIAGIFAVLYAWDVWEAIQSAVLIAENAAMLAKAGDPITFVDWIILTLAMLVPILLWGLAAWIGWKKPVWQLAIIYFVAWAASHVLFFDLAFLLTVL